MRLVATEMLNESMVLAKNIYNGNCLIIKAGFSGIYKFAKNLQNMGISYVYIDDGKSGDIDIPDAISEETREKCKKVLVKTISDFGTDKRLDLVEVSDSIENILKEIIVNKDVQVSLIDICSTDDYTFAHSVSTTVYALLIARELNFTPEKMKKLAMGSLLHDIGKAFLNRGILFKQTSLTGKEFEYIKNHPEFGYAALKDSTELCESSKNIILNHHEALDGSGYPRGLIGAEIDEFSRMVSIADVYDALTTDRCYRKRWTTEKAINFLIEYSDTKFDADLVRIFIQQIAVFPNGSMVRLSDGRLGIVQEQNKNMPLRPIIRVYADENGQNIEMEEVDLLQVLSLTITESELEIQESGGVYMGDEHMVFESLT